MLTFSKQQVANYLIARTGLNSENSFLDILNHLGCIQVDPVSVVAKSHELALYNRAKNFKIEDLYSALYEEHKLFEFWMQLYSIIPIDGFPYMQAIAEVQSDKEQDVSVSWHAEYRNQHQPEIDAALKYIEQHGPTCGKDLSHLPKGGAIHSWKGQSSHNALLEFLWNTGKIQITHRQGNTKYYDLTDRVYPASVVSQKVSPREGYRYLLNSYFNYLGIVRTTNLSRSGRTRSAGLRAEFKQQLAKGEIVEFRVEESKTKYFIQKSKLPDLEFTQENIHIQLNILSPLDPLVIDRQVLADVFDFHYRWEGYTPATKRKFGYYNMPILYKGKFVGQIDLAKDKSGKKSKLITKSLHAELKDSKFKTALKEEIHKLESFCLC